MYSVVFRTATGRLLGRYDGYDSAATAVVHLRRWGYRQLVAGVGRWVEPSSGQSARVVVDLSRRV